MSSLSRKITEALVAYFKTQFVVMVAVAAIVWIILSLIGVRFALLLAIMTGAFATIPVLGLITSAIIASLVAIFDNVRFLPNLPEITEGLAVASIYLLLNVLIDFLLAPYITRKITNAHPFAIFLSVLLGSAIFGIIGAFLAVPVLLVTRTVWKHYKEC